MPDNGRKSARIEENRPLQNKIRSRATEEVEEEVYERGPLKMYVREKAWLNIIQQYLVKREADGVSRDIKYFTLPGRYGIDIGVLYQAGVVHRQKGKWKNVAVCDRDYEPEVIQNLGTFAASSKRPLEHVVNSPRDPLFKFFPVDVINLDFCNSVLANQDEDTDSIVHTNLNTIQSLFGLQRGQGFLLLLTHKIGPNDYGGQVGNILRSTLQFNLSHIPEFRTRFMEVYGTRNINACLQQPLDFSLLTIPKYVARIADRYGYRIEEQFVGFYPRAHGSYHMGVSSFELEPIGRKPTKRYEPRFKATSLDLNDLADGLRDESHRLYSEFVSRLPGRQMVDVDSILGSDARLKRYYTDWGENIKGWWHDIQDQE